MIERHITFVVLLEKTVEFEQFFRDEYRPAMSKMAGFVRAELLREQECPTCYKMVICFQSPEEAAGWRSSVEHHALQPRFKTLYITSNLQVYEVLA